MFVDVAVCLPLLRTFAYRVDDAVEFGCRVVVPFRKREVDGFVVAIRKDAPDFEVHSVSKITDTKSLLRPDVFELCQWISRYYVSPIGEVLKAALPPGIAGQCPRPQEGVAKLRARASIRPQLVLTSDQKTALHAICNGTGFHPVLLHAALCGTWNLVGDLFQSPKC